MSRREHQSLDADTASTPCRSTHLEALLDELAVSLSDLRFDLEAPPAPAAEGAGDAPGGVPCDHGGRSRERVYLDLVRLHRCLGRLEHHLRRASSVA